LDSLIGQYSKIVEKEWAVLILNRLWLSEQNWQNSLFLDVLFDKECQVHDLTLLLKTFAQSHYSFTTMNFGTKVNLLS